MTPLGRSPGASGGFGPVTKNTQEKLSQPGVTRLSQARGRRTREQNRFCGIGVLALPGLSLCSPRLSLYSPRSIATTLRYSAQWPSSFNVHYCRLLFEMLQPSPSKMRAQTSLLKLRPPLQDCPSVFMNKLSLQVEVLLRRMLHSGLPQWSRGWL